MKTDFGTNLEKVSNFKMNTGVFWSILICSLLVASACSSANPWRHSTLPAEQWQADSSACKKKANRQYNRTYGRTDPFTEDSRDSYQRQMSNYDGRKKLDRLVASCMHSRGYVRVK